MTRSERYVRLHLVRELDAIRNKGISRLRNGLTIYEKTVIYYYTDSGYDIINSTLRSNPSAIRKEPASLLLSAVRKVPMYRGVVHRTVTLTDTDRHKLVPGALISESTFVSASRSPLIAKLHADFNVRFQIRSKTSRAIESLSCFPEEMEVVFLPGTQFKVLSVTERADYVLIKMEEL